MLNRGHPEDTNSTPRVTEATGIVILLAVATLAFAQSYARWLDPLIDTGRDLYIPEQLAHGVKLYRDIRYQYPPLVPYLLALITSVIGRSLASYTAIGVAQSAAAATALYLAARRAAGVVGAFAATLLFVSFCMANASTWGVTWIFPYSYAATFGMTFLMIALAALLYERPWLAMAALVLASWCKIELAAAAVLVILGLTVTRRLALVYALVWLAAMLVTFGVAAAYFRDSAWLSGNLFAASLLQGETARIFFARISGTAHWLSNLGAALAGVAMIVAVKIAIRRWEWPLALAVVVICTLLLHDDQIIRAFGLLQWVVLLAAAREEDRPLFTLALFSIAATLRIWLNISPGWYGFSLVLPVFVLLAAVLFERKRLAALWLIPVVVACGLILWEQHQRYELKRYPIVSMRGTFYDVNRGRAGVLTTFLEHVKSGTLVVIPEGISLDYLAGVTTTLTYHTFTPVEIDDPRVELPIVREISAKPPDRIAIVDREVKEFGYRGFGVDYGFHLAKWIAAHYRPEAQLRGPEFWMVVLRRAR